MRYWRILLSDFFSLAVAMTVQAQVVPDKVDVLVIDPGHGGKDPGCHGKTTLEKDVVLSVSKKFGKLVQEKYPDVKVVYTRSDDRFIELWRRGQIANDNHADLFVSIHCNAVDNPSAKGTETWLRGSHKDAANLAEVQRENAVIYQEQNHEANYSQSWLDVVTATVHQDAGFENSIYFADELQSLNPYAWLSLYRNGYRAELGEMNNSRESALYYKVVLLAPETRRDVQSIVLHVSKKDYRPARIILQQRGGEQADIVITSCQTGQNWPDSYFVFDTQRYPSAEVIDLR